MFDWSPTLYRSMAIENAVDATPQVERVAVAQCVGQERRREILVADRAQETPDRQGANGSGAAITGRGVRPAMNHGVRDLYASRPAIDQYAPDLALQDGQQRPGGFEVGGVVHLERRGQLTLYPVDQGPHGGDVRAADEDGGGPEHLLLHVRLGPEAAHIRGEQCDLALIGPVLRGAAPGDLRQPGIRGETGDPLL